jgi:hypothetical protein
MGIIAAVGRPPVALDRLSLLADGRLKYRLKKRWREGTTHGIFEPLEFIEKLAAWVPAPQLNRVRYFGVLGASAGWRPLEDFIRHHSSGCHRKHSGVPLPPIQTAAKFPCRTGSRSGILLQLTYSYCSPQAKLCLFHFFSHSF